MEGTLSLAIPSLRKDGSLNKLTKIIDCEEQNINKEILGRMKQLEKLWKNFVVILKDKEQVVDL
jgi:hypothetical protein